MPAFKAVKHYIQFDCISQTMNDMLSALFLFACLFAFLWLNEGASLGTVWSYSNVTEH